MVEKGDNKFRPELALAAIFTAMMVARFFRWGESKALAGCNWRSYS
jgi:hypothetical protein